MDVSIISQFLMFLPIQTKPKENSTKQADAISAIAESRFKDQTSVPASVERFDTSKLKIRIPARDLAEEARILRAIKYRT